VGQRTADAHGTVEPYMEMMGKGGRDAIIIIITNCTYVVVITFTKMDAFNNLMACTVATMSVISLVVVIIVALTIVMHSFHP